MLHVVIIAGGKGERFWPLSRKEWPKQFLSITGERTMLQMTVDRLRRVVAPEQIWVITNVNYEKIVRDQLPELASAHLILEPVGRDTAACIGMSAIKARHEDPDATLLFVPADHFIEDELAFIASIECAGELYGKIGGILTFGMHPTYPETGYGYIQVNLAECIEEKGYPVTQFLEKPKREIAEKLIQEKNYFWNSGMFLMSASVVEQMIQRFLPELSEGLQVIKSSFGSSNELSTLEYVYPRLPSISIDYGIMEKADNLVMIPCEFGWNDVGSWSALEKILHSDLDDNIIQGKVVHLDTHDCIIHNSANKLIATMGVQEMIVVETDDITLVCSKDKAQQIKELIQELKKKKWEAYL